MSDAQLGSQEKVKSDHWWVSASKRSYLLCRSPHMFPLYLFPGVEKANSQVLSEYVAARQGRRPNFDLDSLRTVEQSIGSAFLPDTGARENAGFVWTWGMRLCY